MPRRIPLLLALAALVACGGDDRKEAEQTLREFVEATNERDAERLCSELMTSEFVEQSIGAEADCERQLGRLKPPRIELKRIERVELDGDRATVTATIEAQGQERDQVFRLKREGGDFRVAGGSGE